MPDTHWDNIDDAPADFVLHGDDTVLIRRPGTQNGGRGVVLELTWQQIVDAIVAAAGAARRSA